MHLLICIIIFSPICYGDAHHASTSVTSYRTSNTNRQLNEEQERPQSQHEWGGPNRTSDLAVRSDNATTKTNETYKPRHIPKKYIIIFRVIRAFSTTGLIITFLVYVLLKNLRSKLIHKCLLAYVFTLLCWDFCEIPWLLNCTLAKNFTDSFMLASFSWLTILCIELRCLTKNIRGIRSSTKNRFYQYSLYVCTGPLILFLITVQLELTDSKNHDPCEMRQIHVIGTCNNYVIPALLAANVYMFLEMANRIFIKERKWVENEYNGMKRHKRLSKTRYLLYLKLFCITGVSWMVYVILRWLDVHKHFETDAALALSKTRGILIFVIFCCNKKVLGGLRKINFG